MCANDNSSLCEYTGDSFRDLTRIARINDKMWAELFLWNKQNLISEIDGRKYILIPADGGVEVNGIGVNLADAKKE